MQPKGGKKRGRKSKAEKEREREDAMSFGGGGLGRGTETRVGSVDMDGGSVRGGGGGSGATGVGAGAGGGNAEEGAEDEEDFEDEGELLGREEGAMDTETEKKNLACVFSSRQHGLMVMMTNLSGYWSTRLIPSNPNDTICSNAPSYVKRLYAGL